MTDHTFGVDKSHFDPAGGTAQIAAEGFGFLTHKAGGDSNDAELNAWWNDAKGHRDDLLLGAYWVLYPGHGPSAGDAFIARLDSQCPGWRDGPFILQLDCEQWRGDPATKPGVGDIRACALRLRTLAPKLMPIVYAPHWAYGNTLSGLGFPLWSSSYTSARGPASVIYPGDNYPGWAAYSGIVPTVAQFSSTATVAGDATTDVNCFKGTRDELTALLAPGWSEDMPLTKADVATILNTDGVIPGPPGSTNPDGTPNEFWSLASYVRNTYNVGVASRAAIAAATATAQQALTVVNALAAKVAGMATPTVDAAALAAALAPLIQHNSAEDLEVALVEAFHNVGSKPAHAKMPEASFTAGSDSDTPIHDEAADAFTRAQRTARQSDIQG